MSKPQQLSEMTRDELINQIASLLKQKDAIIKENQSWRRQNARLKAELRELTK